MDFNEIAIFIKVVQKGSFTGAAKELDMPKSTVSMKITSLEKRLGISLIKRSTRKLQVTLAGEAFFLRVIKGIEEIQAAEATIRSEAQAPRGRFRVTAPVDFGNFLLPELATKFLKKYPEVQIELLLSSRKVNFLEEEVDLAIRAGELKDSSLIAKKIGEIEFKFFASPKFIKEFGAPSEYKDLGSYNCILIETISPTEWNFQSAGRNVKISSPKRTIVNDMSLAKELAVMGVGLVFLPSYLCWPEIKSGKLVPVLNLCRSKQIPFHFVYPNQKYVSVSTKAFIEMAAPLIRERLDSMLE